MLQLRLNGSSMDGQTPSCTIDALTLVRSIRHGMSRGLLRDDLLHAAGLPEEPRGPWVAACVREQVQRNLASGPPSMRVVARQLKMSERTLRRHLTHENTSFRGLVDCARRQRAEHLLRHRRAALSEVSFLCGFHDQSTFSRAFRRWNGMTPGVFRTTQGNAGRRSSGHPGPAESNQARGGTEADPSPRSGRHRTPGPRREPLCLSTTRASKNDPARFPGV